MKTTILIIEDEQAIRSMMQFVLSQAGFELMEAENAKQADLMLANQIPNLILLDWMLPGISGIDYAKQLKKQDFTRDIPIIMLTARAEEESKVKGLEIGADDYITKPFSPKELIARIKAVLRRGPLITPEGILKAGEIVFNTVTNEMTICDKPIKLSQRAQQLFIFLLRNPERIFTRSQILDQVWCRAADITERAVDVYIRRIRKELGPYSDCIENIYGVGYRFTSRKVSSC